MKIGITGYEGQIGSRLLNMGCDPLRCDVTNPKEVEHELHRVKPDVILHLAAQTSVDLCESHYEEAMSANVYGTNVVCEKAEDIIGAGRVVLISTDMTFDGKEGLYKEDSEQNPINAYGLSKLGAEAVARLYDAKVIRISRCFSSKSRDILSYLSKITRGEKIYVPSHLYRSYCHLDIMAEMLFAYANRFDQMPETLHLAGSTYESFYGLIYRIAKKSRQDHLVLPRGEEVGHVARPFKSGLNTSFAESLGFKVPTIEESLERFENETA